MTAGNQHTYLKNRQVAVPLVTMCLRGLNTQLPPQVDAKKQSPFTPPALKPLSWLAFVITLSLKLSFIQIECYSFSSL